MRRDRKMWWNCTGRKGPEGIFCSVPTARSVHCQYRELFIAPLPTDNKNILGLKCFLHHWKQIPNVFIVPLPTAVCREQKTADISVCAAGNLFPNSQQMCEMALQLLRALIAANGRIFLKISAPHSLMRTYHMHLIYLAGQYLLPAFVALRGGGGGLVRTLCCDLS